MKKPEIRREMPHFYLTLTKSVSDMIIHLLTTPYEDISDEYDFVRDLDKIWSFRFYIDDSDFVAYIKIIPHRLTNESCSIYMGLENSKTEDKTQIFDLKPDILFDDYIWCEPGVILTLKGEDK